MVFSLRFLGPWVLGEEDAAANLLVASLSAHSACLVDMVPASRI